MLRHVDKGDDIEARLSRIESMIEEQKKRNEKISCDLESMKDKTKNVQVRIGLQEISILGIKDRIEYLKIIIKQMDSDVSKIGIELSGLRNI